MGESHSFSDVCRGANGLKLLKQFLANPGLIFLADGVTFGRDEKFVAADVTEEDSILVLREPCSPLLDSVSTVRLD
jgi:hypothetical protein